MVDENIDQMLVLEDDFELKAETHTMFSNLYHQSTPPTGIS
ncbi:MAG: hypothetical protein CM15mP59_2350 [Flavobacteriaceae bacterium]|nr:MAG: hypothetical protein CM15mP59_2350 [Flavobacteriaceae bacterium]